MDYKRLIIIKLKEINDDDEKFLRRIYIVLRKHVEKSQVLEQSTDE